MSALRLTFKRVRSAKETNWSEPEWSLGSVSDWRWTLTASNGRIVGASTESYRKRIDAVKNAALVLGLDSTPLAYHVSFPRPTTDVEILTSQHDQRPVRNVRVEVQP